MPPPEYLQLVRDICDKHGVLLIVDEVICGFGRSGEKFGHQNYGVKPDIVTMAKGLTSAYSPLSATAVRAELYESFQREGWQQPFSACEYFSWGTRFLAQSRLLILKFWSGRVSWNALLIWGSSSAID